MKRQIRGLTVVVVSALLGWGVWWWVGHAYADTAQPSMRVVHVVRVKVIVMPVAMPMCTVVPGNAVTQACPMVSTAENEAAMGAAPVAAGAAASGDVVATPVPCITPPGAIFAPDC